MSKNIIINFSAGPGEDSYHEVAYLLGESDEGDRLYAERDYNDYMWKVGIDADEYQTAEREDLTADLVNVLIPVLDYYIYPELREDIVEQAAALGIAEENLAFEFGESYYAPEEEELERIDDLWRKIKEEQSDDIQ